MPPNPKKLKLFINQKYYRDVLKPIVEKKSLEFFETYWTAGVV